ncbi:MAG: DUF4124 domain-containing protein [Fluviicoccus sp.]|uniref:DUF4124 domain-containing protein n=1 Tax=Fluviicoccus sp. TaxID=2003552 RepID=UPI0027177098|nr:DUF4124 domain-containing protein [Fluviicoccus sp.]MDO8331642.1 DUF4124 domain-containing protein [Fluviicoccus sp.]
MEEKSGLAKSFIAITLVIVPLCSHAGLYKCVDGSGRVSFQEQECPGTSSGSEITLKSYKPAVSAKTKATSDTQTPDNQTDMPLVEINTASEADLQSVVHANIAKQIIAEREKDHFRNWADVVHRVVGLSAAQTAVIASISGLTVNGKSLDGAPPDAALAATIKSRRR